MHMRRNVYKREQLTKAFADSTSNTNSVETESAEEGNWEIES